MMLVHVSLLDMFEGRRQLILYRAFFEPGVFGWPEHACRGCSLGRDNTAKSRMTTLYLCANRDAGAFTHESLVYRARQKSCWQEPRGKINMQRLIAASTVLLFLVLVITRIFLMKRTGVKAVYFGNIDKKDFLIPPLAFLYIYIVIAAPFGLPAVTKQEFFRAKALSWVGVFLCGLGLLLFLVSLISFGRSFRVGIDTDEPGELVTTGIFARLGIPSDVAFWTMSNSK